MRWVSLSLILVMIAVAACSGGDDDSADVEATSPPTSTATVEPTTTLPADPTITEAPTITPTTEAPPATATASPTATEPDPPTSTATLVPTTEPTATTPPATATSPPASTAADTATPPDDEALPEDSLAETFLIQLSDLPPGWNQQAIADDEPDSDEPNICDSPDIDTIVQFQGRSEASFYLEQTGPFFNQLGGILASEEEAAEVVELLRGFFDCGEWSTTDDNGNEVFWTLEPLEFPAVGDESLALRATVTFSEFAFQADVIAFQRGRAVTILQHLDLDTVDTQLTISLAETIDERMTGI